MPKVTQEATGRAGAKTGSAESQSPGKNPLGQAFPHLPAMKYLLGVLAGVAWLLPTTKAGL